MNLFLELFGFGFCICSKCDGMSIVCMWDLVVLSGRKDFEIVFLWVVFIFILGVSMSELCVED